MAKVQIFKDRADEYCWRLPLRRGSQKIEGL